MTGRRWSSLTAKIFAGTAMVVSAVLGLSLLLTSRSATRTARGAIDRTLEATREQVHTLLAARERTLLSGASVFVLNPRFRSIVESRETGTILDQAYEAVEQTGAHWVQITDAAGVRLAKSNDPGAGADSLAGASLIGTALGGTEAQGYGLDDDGTLFQGVAVPIYGATPGRVVGVLMAALVLDSAFVAGVRAASGGTTEIIVYSLDLTGAPHLAASTVAETDELHTKLAGWRPDSAPGEMRPEIELGGQHFEGLGAPLLSAGGFPVGGYLALRSRESALAPFLALQRTILFAGAAGIGLAFVLSFLIAQQITRPVNALVAAARKATDGDYATEIAVRTRDEVGTLADAFRRLLADLRDKQALVELLQGDSAGRTVLLPTAGGATVAASAQSFAPGMTLARRYHILGVLGAGGMGTVYKAHDAELDEPVAIKTLRPEVLSRDPMALERFKGEIRLARRISHRNVVRTHDLGEADGLYFISMEYVEGTSLKDLIRARGRLPAAATVRIGKQLLRALEIAHEQGVIHRDIKPQNIVVTRDGVLKVMDFGIARLASRSQGVTQAGTVVGTPEYMAPEQLLGDEVDIRVDIYAVGVVLYECLTGTLPFTAESPITLITKVLETVPASPRTLDPEIPAALAELVMRALEKDPQRRPQTVTAMHDAIDRVMVGN